MVVSSLRAVTTDFAMTTDVAVMIDFLHCNAEHKTTNPSALGSVTFFWGGKGGVGGIPVSLNNFAIHWSISILIV